MLDGEDGLVRRKLVQRTAAERAAVVAETYQPGATVAGVAARHGIQPSQLSAWRSAARKKVPRADAGDGSLGFAEVAVIPETANAPYDVIEIMLGVLVVRLPKSTPSKRVVEIARGVMAR